MAYEKHEWQTGEVITAENLNHVEEGIKGLSDKLFETIPSKVAVFEEQSIETINNGTEGVYEYEFATSDLAYDVFGSPFALPSKMIFTLDGAEYEVPLVMNDQTKPTLCRYGSDETAWSTYPFGFFVTYNWMQLKTGDEEAELDSVYIITQSQGNHTLKMEYIDVSVTVSSLFKTAVAAVLKDMHVAFQGGI